MGLAALFLTAESSQGAGHGGGHGGGGHGGGHGGGFHGGGFHGGGYRGGWGGYRGRWHGGGWNHYARGWHGGWGGYGRGWYGHRWYGGGYWPWWGSGYWGYPGSGYWDYPAYSYSDYPFGSYYTDYSSAPSYYTNTPVYTSAYGPTSGTYTAAPAADEAARMTVRVPSDAQVWFQNQPMKQQGPVRYYQSPQLTPGQDYTYDIRAQWREGGRVVSRTRHVDVQAGSNVNVDFTAPNTGQRQASASAGTSGS